MTTETQRVFRSFLCVSVACCVSVVLAAAARGAGPQPKLEFHASFDKTSYTRNDPLLVTFTLKNAGKQPVWVNTRFYLSSQSAPDDDRDVSLILTSPSGKEIPCTFSYPTGFPKSDYFKLLQPGEEAASEHPRDLRGFFDLKEAGTYTVRAVYQNVFGAELGLDAAKGPLRSEPVAFAVTQ